MTRTRIGRRLLLERLDDLLLLDVAEAAVEDHDLVVLEPEVLAELLAGASAGCSTRSAKIDRSRASGPGATPIPRRWVTSASYLALPSCS